MTINIYNRYLLSNERIKSIHTDLRRPISDYSNEIGNQVSQQQCLQQIGSIIRHHCGDHSKCTVQKYCTYLQVKTENPTWDEEQLKVECARRSNRHGGRSMDLSEKGILKLEAILDKRLNAKTIDKIA